MNDVSQEAKRARRREYMRKWRAERAAEQGRPMPEESQPIVTGQPDIVIEQPSAQCSPEVAQTTTPIADETKKREGVLRQALAGTVQTIADSAQLMMLDNAAPHLGKQRADYIADLWAPVLAPYINEKTAQHLPLVLASSCTAATLYQWAHEYREHQAKKQKPFAVIPIKQEPEPEDFAEVAP